MDTFFLGSIFFAVVNSFVWLLIPICFIIQVFGIRFYKIIDQRKADVILRKLKNNIISSNYVYYNSEFKHHGIFISWYCVGNIQLNGEIFEICIITTQEYIDNLIKDSHNEIIPKFGEIVIEENKKEITIYNRQGYFGNLHYEESTFFLNKKSKTNQNLIVHSIIKYYKDNNYCTSFINGIPGSGKTTIAYLLAKELNGSMCKTFNPTDAGDHIQNLIRRVNPTSENPLIVLLDEIDIMINNIHNNKINTHKHTPVPVRSKTDFNRFLDDVEIHYKNVIFILTSNTSLKDIEMNTKDSSYLREGRVHLYFTM
jgi:hypothetical protein